MLSSSSLISPPPRRGVPPGILCFPSASLHPHGPRVQVLPCLHTVSIFCFWVGDFLIFFFFSFFFPVLFCGVLFGLVWFFGVLFLFFFYAVQILYFSVPPDPFSCSPEWGFTEENKDHKVMCVFFPPSQPRSLFLVQGVGWPWAVGAALPPPVPSFLRVFLSSPFVGFSFSQLQCWAARWQHRENALPSLRPSPFISASY